MKRSHRVVILVLGTAAGLGIPSVISLFSKITDTVLAAFIALFGVIFTAIFSEVSSYYSDRGLGMQKKWELVFPLLRDYYNPWIQSASYFSGYLKEIKGSKPFSPEQATRILFYVSLFFSSRLRFSLKAGGRPILAEDSDEENVLEAYRALEKTLDWTDHQNRRTEISFLQQSFMQKDSPDKAYSSYQFAEDVKVDARLQKIRDEIQAWLTKDHAEKTAQALDEFQSRFKKGINKLYSGWAS